MKLREVIDRLMKVNDWDQTELGQEIGGNQPMVSRMRKGDDWEQHWQVFLKLLPLIAELKMIKYKELIPMSDKVEAKGGIKIDSNSLKSEENSAKKESPVTPIMSPLRKRSAVSSYNPSIYKRCLITTPNAHARKISA